MKNICVLVIMLSLLGCSSQPEEGVKLTGNVEEFPDGGFAFVEIIGENNAQIFDTLEVDDEGNFSEVLAIEKPDFYRINFNGRQIITLVLTGEEEEVVVNAQGNDPRGFFEVSGSYDTEYKNQIDELMQNYRQQIGVLQEEQLQARNNNDLQTFQSVEQRKTDLAYKTEGDLRSLISEVSPSLAAFYGMQMLDIDENLTFMDSIANQLQVAMPENLHVAGLISQVSTKKKLSIGRIAPEISLQNPDGETISLTSLRGNYVLVDFWAAWCRPCRAENPNLVRAYQKYEGENFEILQVSLDRTRDKWLQAIEQDGLPWLHISDLKYWQSKAAIDYQIRAIPASFLIDPDGKIIGKNLRGPMLEAKLKEIFG